MPEKKNNTKNFRRLGSIALIGICSLSVLIIYSLVFYQERTIFTDIAYHIFYILKNNDFAIQNNRWGAFFTQLFPLIASKAGCSLKTIALLYSASFELLPLLAFLLLIFIFKNEQLSTAYLLFLLLFSTHTFYWIQSELPQGIAFMFLFYACFEQILKSNKRRIKLTIISIALLFITVFSHPLLLFAFYFIILFKWIDFPEKKKTIIGFAILYGLLFFLKSICLRNAYDTQALSGLKNFKTLFPNYFFIVSNKNFLKYCLHDYYFLPISGLTLCIYYFKEKNYLKLLLIIISSVGYLFIVNVSYAEGAEQYYLENQYLILGIIIGVPLAFDFIQKCNLRTANVILITICSIGILRISKNHIPYTSRIEYEENLLSKTEKLQYNKLIISQSPEIKKVLMLSWASSYEFWLLSTIDSKVSRSLIIEESPGEFDWRQPNNKIFITKWEAFEYASLKPKSYFNFTDTNSYVKFKE